MRHISTIFQFKLYVILGLLLTIFYVLRAFNIYICTLLTREIIMTPRLKQCLLAVLLTGGCLPSAFSQVEQKRDTLPARDSIVEIPKENLQDNIPVISLTKNDGQDGSAQNVSSQLSAGP